MNSPYTKHLDATLDAPSHSHAMAMPTYQQAPMPMVVQQPAAVDSGSGKAAIALVAVILAIVAGVAGWAIGSQQGPTWNELRRFEALAGREGEIRGRDSGWATGRKQGREELKFLAQYEKLRTNATAFNQGWNQGLGTGRRMGNAESRYRYGNSRYGYGGGYARSSRRGYGSYYGGSSAVRASNAQAMADATGQPVTINIP